MWEMRNHKLMRNPTEVKVIYWLILISLRLVRVEGKEDIALHDKSFIGTALRLFISETNPHQYQCLILYHSTWTAVSDNFFETLLETISPLFTCKAPVEFSGIYSFRGFLRNKQVTKNTTVVILWLEATQLSSLIFWDLPSIVTGLCRKTGISPFYSSHA